MLSGKKYKAVFSDIDGTILNTSHQVPEKTKEKIIALHDQEFRLYWYQPECQKG